MKLVCAIVVALVMTGCFAPHTDESWYQWHANNPNGAHWYARGAWDGCGGRCYAMGPSLDFSDIDRNAALNRQADAIETQNIILQGQSNNEAGYGWQHR